MSNYNLIVRIDGEPFLSRVKEYRAKKEALYDACRAFAKDKGAASIPGSLSGLVFEGSPPEGWRKPDRKGWSRPKKGHPDEQVIAALPKRPSAFDVLGDSVCYNLNYTSDNGDEQGFGSIGFFFDGPRIGWAGGTFFAVIPDAKKAAEDHLRENPDHKITSGADMWRLPEGLTAISEAEMDLIVARYKAEQEQAKT